MNLHPEDIAEVLAKGWGQRHPLAWGRAPGQEVKARWWFPMRVRSPLPETFMLIYSPRGKQAFSFQALSSPSMDTISKGRLTREQYR